MPTQPTQPTKAAAPPPPAPAPKAADPHPPAKHEPPPPVKTIADEQRERSDEIMKMGVEKWKAAHDERDPDAKPEAVRGVTQPRVEAHNHK